MSYFIDTNNFKTKKTVATAWTDVSTPIRQNKKISMNTITSTNSELTLADGGIRIGKGIHQILVSGSVFVDCKSTIGYAWISIKKNDVKVSISIAPRTVSFISVSFAPRIVNVTEGDIISFWDEDTAYEDTARRNENTWLTVEVLN